MNFNVGDYVYAGDCYEGKIVRIENNIADVEFSTDGGGGCLPFTFSELEHILTTEHLRPCPICGEKINDSSICLWGGTPTLLHTCVSGIKITVQGHTKYEVIRKWNTLVNIIS